MSNQIIVSVGRSGGSRLADIDNAVHYRVRQGSGEPVYIQSDKYAVYQLADADSGLMPENIELIQAGKHLHIRTKGSDTLLPDVVIEDYYTYTEPEERGKVIAWDSSGKAHYYVEKTPEHTLLAEEVTVNRAASGGVNKLAVALGGLAGAGLVGALAGGGGSGKSSDGKAEPAASDKQVQAAKNKAEILNPEPESASKAAFSDEKESTENGLWDTVAKEVSAGKSGSDREVAATQKEVEINQGRPSEIVFEVKTEPEVKKAESEVKAEPEVESESASRITASDSSENLAEAEKVSQQDVETDIAVNNSDKSFAESETVSTVEPADSTEAKAFESGENTGSSSTVSAEIRYGKDGHFYVYQHESYGRYIDAAEFGTDATGNTDSLAAINRALAAAHEEKAAVRLSGNLYISDQIVLNEKNAGVTAIFGEGMGKTVVSFDKAQKGVFNPNTNEDDVRGFAGILVDGQSNKTIADLSVKYTNPDFYRTGQSYFGKVNGILVNDADNTLISKVEVSGANRAGVFFTSTQALTKDPESEKGRTYKARLILKEVDEHYENLPLGENNRIVDSYLHHNRVAGALVAYQKNFVADGNNLAWNGHETDGGTGYGISSMAGSYNFGVTFTNNTTDHNYRKGLDVHDGDDIVIQNNTLLGDRLYGVAVYNRQFTMDTVKIAGNTIIQDHGFRLDKDDNAHNYHGYSAIQLQTNTQFRDLNSSSTGIFEIHGNTVRNLAAYKNAQHTYGIEFRNHEQKMHYKLDISNNVIEGESSKYMIAIINNTLDRRTGEKGLGSGDINISGNTMNIGAILTGNMPIFINEHNNDGKLRGKITIDNNSITTRHHSDGTIEGIQMLGNAESYHITNNRFEIHGNMNKPLLSIAGRVEGETPELHVYNNDITTDLTGNLYRSWIEHRKADVFADNNTHNNKPLDKIQHIIQPEAGLQPENREAAADTEWHIGTDSISGVPVHHTAGNGILSARSETVVLDTDNDEKSTAEAYPALNSLLSVTELDFAVLTAKPSHAVSAGNADIYEYRQSVDVLQEQWQSEVSAYIV